MSLPVYYYYYLESGFLFCFGAFTRGRDFYEFLVPGIWYLGLALSAYQFLSNWWVFHPCLNWLL